jgi:hypothetical protein
MACPYFRPREPLGGSAELAAILPLGAAWAGICQAASEPAVPEATQLMPFCNLGYARGSCSRFADEGGPDAVRFAVSQHTEDFVQLSFVLERDHRPHAHGTLTFDIHRGMLTDPPAGEIFRAQALAYLSRYLQRKNHVVVR